MDHVDRQGLKVVDVETTTHGRVLVRASASASPSGVLLGFHGYMENAALQLERLRKIHGADRWILASVQALHRFYRGRTDEVVASWMTRQDRERAIADNIAYVDRAVDAALRSSSSDARTPVVCIGFSQGGAMAFRAGVRCRFPASGIVSVGADVPPDLVTGADARFPPILFARGARDDWLTADVFERDLTALRKRGADVRPLVYDGAHEWTADVDTAVGEFLTTLSR